MKNPRISLLIVLTLLVLSFTLGLFFGRNYGGSDVTVSFPDAMKMPAPAPASIADISSGEDISISVPVNINTATLEELVSLPGIGEGLAGQILAYREINGGFSHTEELLNVPGIGEKRLESILNLITTGGT